MSDGPNIISKSKYFLFGWQSNIEKSFDTRETKALIRYAIENGINPVLAEPKEPGAERTYVVSELHKAVRKYDLAMEDYTKGETTNPSVTNDELVNLEARILDLYSELNKYTTLNTETVKSGYHVNGRTLIETKFSGRTLLTLFVTTAIFTLLAITNEVLNSWQAEVVLTDDGFDNVVYSIHRHVFSSLVPFIWGGLGACMYLSMNLYDIAKYRAFDRTKLHGWVLRVILGSILAAVTVYLFNPTAFTKDELPLEAKSLAFLVGLSVKVVYGAFEKIVQTLIEKFNLDSLKREGLDQGKNLMRLEIAKQLADPDLDSSQEKQQALIELLKANYKK